MALAALGQRGWWKRRARRAAASAPGSDDPIQHLMDALDEPLLVIEATHVTHANRAARDLLGDHVAGGDVRLVLRHPDAIALFAGKEEGPVELTGLGGHDRHWVLSARGIGSGARLLRLVDRSARRAAERMRVDFVANASHELRTPLAALVGFIETLEDANAPEDAAARTRFLKIMSDEAKRMQRLIDDLMSLSRIEADRYSVPRGKVDLAALLRDTCTDITAARTDGDRLQLAIETQDATVIGDKAQLSQIIHNIIDNALKYGRSDTPVRATLAPASAGRLRLTVEDQGEGIAIQHLPRLTERFYRVDPGRSRAIGGTGLGLAIVKHIVERHRGRLDIDSVVGRGTTVSVELPLASV
jgi:two-component system phosphate regulon sensor histidine kinase PhoR